VGTHAYYQTVNVLRDDAARLNLAVLEQSEEILNRLLVEIRDIVSLLSLDPDLLKLMLRADSQWSPETIYQFSLQKTELNKLSTNKFFSQLFVYLRKSDAILSSTQVERLSTLPMTVGNVTFGEWLQKVIADEQLNRYHHLKNVNNGDRTGNYLAYVSSLPSGSGASADGAVVILIDELSINRLFNRLLVNNGSFAYIMDANNEMVSSVSASGEDVLPIEIPADGQGNYHYRIMNGTNMLITFTRSFQHNWTYVAGLPAEAVLSKADYIKRINWTIAGIALVLSCLIALIFAYRNSKPLTELLESIKEFAGGEAGKKSNEMDLLQSTVHQIISNNRSLNVKMNQQLPILQSACFERLLKSGFNHEREWRAHCEEAKISLFEQNVIVAIIKIHDTEFTSESEELEMIAKKAMVRKLLEQEWQEGCYVHERKIDKLALIYSYSGSKAEEGLSLLEKQLEKVQISLLREYRIMTSIGIGQLYHTCMDIWRSYNEAGQALEVQEPDTPQQLVRYDTISHNSNQYYYPLDLELKLMNTVKMGDSEGLERLFEHIETQNFQLRQLSQWRKKQLYQEMQGTLQKLTEQVQAISGLTEQQQEKLINLEPSETDSSFIQLRSIFISISDHIKQQKNNKYQGMFESIKSYILENYADNNLSLSRLASDHKQTESFISTYFKEQMGITFSEYVERLRLEEACKQLRESELPIQEIAIQVGYSSDKSFRRAFKRAYGIQPTSFRNDQQE
jgi:two-component system response regulator YesN